MPSVLPGAGHVYNQYKVRFLNNKRDELQGVLKEKGVATALYYPFPLHRMGVFLGKCEIFENLTQAEKASQGVLSLPVEPLLNEAEVQYVVDILVESLCHIS